MTAAGLFAHLASSRFDYECPAVQDAIDRLVEGEYFRGRSGMVEAMQSAMYRRDYFCSALLSAWKPNDILLATGISKDNWLKILDAQPEGQPQ